jgi:hypothetical protein
MKRILVIIAAACAILMVSGFRLRGTLRRTAIALATAVSRTVAAGE